MRQLAVNSILLLLSAGCASDSWRDSFEVRAGDFASSGRSAFCILEPGYQTTLEGEEDGGKARLVITVLPDTKIVDGVETRIVEERETVDGVVIEVSRNYFAIDKRNHDVYYFGEDVDIFKDGKLANHGGSWESGKKGAHYGLFIPNEPKVGQKFYQELAPKVAMDRVEIASMDESIEVPAGKFKDCLKTEETSALESGKEHKFYARDVGLLIDGGLKLVKYGMSGR